jgi:hypothetical protein
MPERTQPKADERPFYILGLDLGQAADYTALAIAEKTTLDDAGQKGQPVTHYGIRHLQRWALGTPYPQIVADLAAMLAREPLKDGNPALAVDQTGVGRAVVDMLRQARLPAFISPILITSGHAVTHEGGAYHVPKKELVSVLQALLQTRRLRIADLPVRKTLLDELLAFKVKITTAANETFESWRERDHDDLLFAMAMAVWLGERTGPFWIFRVPRREAPSIQERIANGGNAMRRGLFGMG